MGNLSTFARLTLGASKRNDTAKPGKAKVTAKYSPDEDDDGPSRFAHLNRPGAAPFSLVASARQHSPQLFAAPRATGPNDLPDQDPNNDEQQDDFKNTDELIENMRKNMPELFPTPKK